MVLDADRDGTVDLNPLTATDHEEWTWGPEGEGIGAIVMARTRTYADNQAVDERSQISFRWTGRADYNWGAGGWRATLKVEPQAKLRIYSTRNWLADNTNRVFDGTTDTLDLTSVPGAANSLRNNQQLDLWLEATDFPSSADDAGAEIKLTYSSKVAEGPQIEQTAVVRIAPWIMSSDLDPTHRFFLRFSVPVLIGPNETRRTHAGKFTNNDYANAYNPLPNRLQQILGAGFVVPCNVDAGRSKKGFARDVMKCGHVAAPHFSGTVIKKCPDPGSPLEASLLDAAKAVDHVGGAVLDLQEADPTPKDQGGNLLVSPPTDDYPYGRILYGDQCQARTFFEAQQIQSPIQLEAGWLRVGHVDEMLSFARGDDGYYALLLSPRLGYIILRGVAARDDNSADELLTWANEVNDQCIAAGAYNQDYMLQRIGNTQNKLAGPTSAHEVADYEANPDTPDADRHVVLRLGTTGLASFWGAAQHDITRAFPTGRISFEVRVHATKFLQEADQYMLQFTGAAQPPIDRTRTILTDELGIPADHIIEVPALLNNEFGLYVTITADSVNMLVRGGDGPSNCIVPKPFGPVFDGAYLFEKHIHDALDAAGIAHQFLVDDAYHFMEGEIHCASNQVHPPLAGNRAKWWETPPS